MRLANYEMADSTDKKQWLNSISMTVGLTYFGGKSVIGKYLLNNIFNLSVQMKKQGERADIFIDAFTGGGKIGLSIPLGWYDTIVINDINYGVYSYFKCCKENYVALIKMIEEIGRRMNKEFFYLSAYARSFRPNVDKLAEGKQFVPENEEEYQLVAGALTYWVTASAFNAITAPQHTRYNLAGSLRSMDDENEKYDKEVEKANINKIIRRAYKNIPKLHEKLNRQHYIIENLDYKELIKKYNGKQYTDLQGEIHIAEEENKNKHKLWYFDPPYHPYTLYCGKDAPYADTFSEESANEMIDILCGKHEEEYGEIKYFIKSDYDPKETYKIAVKDQDNINVSEDRRSWYKKLIKKEKKDEERKIEKVIKIFEKLENDPFCKISLGGFDKGTILNTGERSVGQEYIWCRGFPEGYESIEGETAKE